MSGTSIDQLFQQAVAHHRAGRLREADSLYRQVLAAKPDHADALHMLGWLAQQAGITQAAVPLIRQAISINPSDPEYHTHLGMALLSVGQLDDAIASFRKSLDLKRSNPEVLFFLANALQARGMLDEAIETYRKSLAYAPGVAQAHANLGAALKQAGRSEEAVVECRRALMIQPSSPEAMNNLGGILQDQGQFAEAMQTFRNLLATQPNFAEARMSLGLALLLQGEFKEGWPAYEARRQIRRIARDFGFAQPYWDGSPLGGRTILLASEQGFGDTIQFARYAPLVAARGGQVVLQCKPELKRLLTGQCGIEQVFSPGDPVPAFDVWCLLMSLPHLMETTLETVPAQVPYLAPDPWLVRIWAERMKNETPGLKVGLVWAGGPHNKNDRVRSISLAALAPLANVPGVRFYSLQKGPASEQARALPQGMQLTDWSPELHDFADTAALVANLDLVISVDTAVAHLAGAIGKPVWLLIPLSPDFRWLLNRADSPWYPTMRIFRQPARGDWSSVIGHVTNALRATSEAAAE